jgi:hypothetical protein
MLNSLHPSVPSLLLSFLCSLFLSIHSFREKYKKSDFNYMPMSLVPTPFP